jgi:hypothetical protein
MLINVAHTPYRKGYFMNPQDQQRAKGELFLKYDDTKERLVLLKHEAKERAKEFRKSAEILEDRPEDLVITDAETFKYYGDLKKLIADINETQKELRGLETTLREARLEHKIK